jgi:hypothetical protein
MPTPIRRVGGPLEDVAPQDGWRSVEAWRGGRITWLRLLSRPQPLSGILGLRQTHGHIRNREGVTRADSWSDCPAEIWRAMIVSVVLLGSIKTLLQPSQCRQVRSSCGSGLLSAGAGLGLVPRLVRNHRIFSVAILILPSRRSRRARLAPWEGPKYPIIGDRRWIAHRG